MKNLLCIIIFFIQIKSFAQETKDTIFLQKKEGYNIYIDPNKDPNSYNDFYNEFKDFPKGNLNLKFPNKWIPAYKYQEKYYIYKPCDCHNPIIKITNKKTYQKCFEESEYKNIKILVKGNNYIEITYINFSKQKEKLKITYLEEKKGIAIFEFINNKKQSNYLLMVDLEKIKKLPIIVNDCKLEKVKEFEFDKIDYKQLLKSKK